MRSRSLRTISGQYPPHVRLPICMHAARLVHVRRYRRNWSNWTAALQSIPRFLSGVLCVSASGVPSANFRRRLEHSFELGRLSRESRYVNPVSRELMLIKTATMALFRTLLHYLPQPGGFGRPIQSLWSLMQYPSAANWTACYGIICARLLAQLNDEQNDWAAVNG
jgi:hypothetical protein